MTADLPAPGTGTPARNSGHGHVYPRPDGVKAHCGGPALCRTCRADEARKNGAPATNAEALALIDELLAAFLIPHDPNDPLHSGWTRGASVREDVADGWRARRAALSSGGTEPRISWESSPRANDDPDGSKGASYFADLVARFGCCTCAADMTASCEPSESECALCARLDPDWPCPTREHVGYPRGCIPFTPEETP